RPGARGRPHLDLPSAVAAQLGAAGVERIVHVDVCTRCRAEWLWSHRRDGEGCGRNLALIWRSGA
ncbi:MAG: laccase domain-containing protein, partial [Thermoanaerobaculia bacterium]